MIEQIGEIIGAHKAIDRAGQFFPARPPAGQQGKTCIRPRLTFHGGVPAAFANTRAMNFSCWITALS